jgi:hypothetical protein
MENRELIEKLLKMIQGTKQDGEVTVGDFWGSVVKIGVYWNFVIVNKKTDEKSHWRESLAVDRGF